jgi:uncharacterized protein YeaO (DUF488 family)
MTRRLSTRRVYEDPHPDDGLRVLVDRLWPRGLTKEAARVDHWMKELAPSTELRKWFDHRVERWPEFQQRYARELDGKPELVDELAVLLRKGPVTLVFGAKDEEHSQAIALAAYMRDRRAARKR